MEKTASARKEKLNVRVRAAAAITLGAMALLKASASAALAGGGCDPRVCGPMSGGPIVITNPGVENGPGGGTGGPTPIPSSTPDQQWPTDSFVGAMPASPPNPNLGSSNEALGRDSIDDALDLFGKQGTRGSLSGGAAEAIEKFDDTFINNKNDLIDATTIAEPASSDKTEPIEGGVKTVSFGTKTAKNDGAKLFGTEDRSGARPDRAVDVADNFGSYAHNTSDGSRHDMATDDEASRSPATGEGEVGLDGPDDANNGNLVESARDEYFVRAGKISLFEIVNRRYEVWGSQNLR